MQLALQFEDVAGARLGPNEFGVYRPEKTISVPGMPRRCSVQIEITRVESGAWHWGCQINAPTHGQGVPITARFSVAAVDEYEAMRFAVEHVRRYLDRSRVAHGDRGESRKMRVALDAWWSCGDIPRATIEDEENGGLENPPSQ